MNGHPHGKKQRPEQPATIQLEINAYIHISLFHRQQTNTHTQNTHIHKHKKRLNGTTSQNLVAVKQLPHSAAIISCQIRQEGSTGGTKLLGPEEVYQNAIIHNTKLTHKMHQYSNI